MLFDKNTFQLGEWIAIYIFYINLICSARRERKPSVSKHLAVASSGAVTDQSWASQPVLSNPSHRSSTSPLVSNLYPDSSVKCLLLFPVLPPHKHVEERQKPVSCNQSVYSASVMQVTPSAKLQNITSEAPIYHADEIMKLLLSESFYSFVWSTSNFSTTECRTSPLLITRMWLGTGRCCHNQNHTFSRKNNHLTISLHKQQLWFIEIMLEKPNSP